MDAQCIYMYIQEIFQEECKTRRICYQPFDECPILTGILFEYPYKQDFCTLFTN